MDDTAAAEIAAWRAAAEDAHAWGDGMRLVMLAALFGTDRTGRNAAVGRILREWAVEQIEECPGAENYLEISLDYTESTPGLVVLVHIQREDAETPGSRATRLQAERDAAVARAEAAEREVARLRGDCTEAGALLSEGLEIVEGLSAGFDVWAERARCFVISATTEAQPAGEVSDPATKEAP